MQTLTVAVIGAGRVGTVLGAALTRAGHRVSVTSFHRAEPAAADLILLTVPDDALPQVVAGLRGLRPGQVLAHTSGSHGLEVLAPATRHGVRPLALHPVMTFTGHAADLERLPGIRYGVTAPAELRPFATRLVADLGGSVEWVAENRAGSTTRRRRPARTTWSPSSTRRRTGCGRRAWPNPVRCWPRCCARPWRTPWLTATPR